MNNTQTQLKLERISSLAKETKIKSCEELLIKLGYNPNDVKAAKEIIKRKSDDIAALRK